MAFRKLSPDVRERVLQAIRIGATYELACAYAGISRESLRRYRKDVAFVAEVEKAEGQAALGWLATIEKAARDGEWTAAAWKLERRYPQVYGRRQLEVTGRDGGPIPLALVPFAYADVVADLEPPDPAPRPAGDRAPPRALASGRDGPPLGQNPDGG